MYILSDPNTMMYVFSKKLYTLQNIQKSNRKHKKYKALLKHKKTNKLYTIHFGDNRYEQYEDKIGLYKHLNHFDKKRRKAFRARNKHRIIPGFMSAASFAQDYLW